MAMVKLAKEIDFDSSINIRPICLPTDRSKLYVGRTVTVSGWGLTEQDKLSHILKELDLKVEKQKNCELGLKFLADNLQPSTYLHTMYKWFTLAMISSYKFIYMLESFCSDHFWIQSLFPVL